MAGTRARDDAARPQERTSRPEPAASDGCSVLPQSPVWAESLTD